MANKYLSHEEVFGCPAPIMMVVGACLNRAHKNHFQFDSTTHAKLGVNDDTEFCYSCWWADGLPSDTVGVLRIKRSDPRRVQP